MRRSAASLGWGCALLILHFAALPLGAGGKPPAGAPVALRAPTLQAFNRYVESTQAQNNKSLRGENFLWVDDLSKKEKEEAYVRLNHGEIEMRRLQTGSASSNAEIPGEWCMTGKGWCSFPE